MTYIRFFCMLIKGSSRICLNHVAECFQDDSQIQDPILQHLKCLLCFILIWYVLSAFCIHTTVLRMLQSVTESLSLIQNKSLPFYLTLWDCLTCHYTHIYPIWPMNLSTYLSISRQKNPLCEKKFPYYTERYGRSAVPFLQRLLNEDYEKQRKNLKCQLQVNNDVTYNVPIT